MSLKIVKKGNLMKKYNVSEKIGMLRSRLSIILEDRKYKTNVKINKRVFLLLKGFNSFHYNSYELNKNDMNDYLSEYQRRKTRFINGEASYILGNKLACDQILKQYVKTPEIYSLIINGEFIPISNKEEITNCSEFITLLKNRKKVILKPNSGTDGGRGVLLATFDKEFIMINNEKKSEAEVKNFLENLNNYIICEFQLQGSFGENLYKETVNTLRVLTLQDPYTKKPYILSAVHRIGNKKSIPVDNGSLSAGVNLEDGRLGKASFHGNTNSLEWFSNHPETGAKIEGVQIPNWDRIKDEVIELASKFPHIPYVGWDLVLLDNSIAVIEANNCSDATLLQIHNPLLNKKYIKELYQKYGIVK